MEAKKIVARGPHASFGTTELTFAEKSYTICILYEIIFPICSPWITNHKRRSMEG
jgi:hypothetical protein